MKDEQGGNHDTKVQTMPYNENARARVYLLLHDAVKLHDSRYAARRLTENEGKTIRPTRGASGQRSKEALPAETGGGGAARVSVRRPNDWTVQALVCVCVCTPPKHRAKV
ncbi:hypothetical protein O3P69_005485 [Scylla paramamosain]|uniref:Uncharacterized protein n=1 Tax=Scylla paramamosain TaxID=85552 RepID=A0AAW0UAB4_SCYPA